MSEFISMRFTWLLHWFRCCSSDFLSNDVWLPWQL